MDTLFDGPILPVIFAVIVVYLIMIGLGIRYLLKIWAIAPEPDEPPPHDDAPLRSHGRHGLMSPTQLAPGE
jgi:hypothetical protein